LPPWFRAATPPSLPLKVSTSTPVLNPWKLAVQIGLWTFLLMYLLVRIASGEILRWMETLGVLTPPA
jgi:hypothetical protein